MRLHSWLSGISTAVEMRSPMVIRDSISLRIDSIAPCGGRARLTSALSSRSRPSSRRSLSMLLLPLDLGQQNLFPAFGAVYVAGPQLGRQAVALAIEQQHGVITRRFEVSVVCTLLLLSVHWDLGGIQVQDCPVA